MTYGTISGDSGDFERRARENQRQRIANLKPAYDFVICGAGSAGSVIARRLAENPACNVLLIEAGGSDEAESVLDPALWPTNLGSQRDWGFQAEPNPHLDGRAISMSMGKGLGGGSSVNVMVWARGHRSDWDHFATESGDPDWGYQSVLDIYRRIENWQGAPDPQYRGTNGPVWVQPARNPSPLAGALLDAAEAMGIPRFENPNGRMMEGCGGAAYTDMLVRDGRRHSLYRAYVRPFADRPNLTILTDTLVRRVLFDKRRAIGVEIERAGTVSAILAGTEVIISTGAINTPKLLMLSGLGDRAELDRHGIPLVRHLPGVGHNLQDHVSFGCTWEYRKPMPPQNSGSEATLYWKTWPELDAPDLLFCQVEFPVPSERTALRGVPAHGWTMFAGLAHPHSRGQVRLKSADPSAMPVVDANMLSDPRDMEAARACVKLCRELGNSDSFQPYVSVERIPGAGSKLDDDFIRDAAVTYWHQCGTARMGLDDMAVVDASLAVHGVEGLRVADGSILPRVTTGNTQAPCAVIGERAADILRREHGL
ncbi:MAG: GMC family oxidoreductase N-terminal domain-containing protein [Alphaproteobacteria bacterium]|nr:GMC family oxidoreductase N-terminal domain-containing protein [Alphaproteobacteria bacterium]MBU0792562.1 GMC family oxidoreductase N-terminal domain-containing protein [Alphaproteobacteria bacterium]MBU0874771.1 GMC family oxidoreductase N-terminal domain-containing protein [Alphaproteobacteria bacterium]MBU1768629.1 GMC family oxidoreductase N-terminal domain-containing protein [Alphaproteobacteria bacterium]